MDSGESAIQLDSFSLLSLAFSLRAQSSNLVQYYYDDAGRLTKIVDPSGNVATYNYNPVGNCSPSHARRLHN